MEVWIAGICGQQDPDADNWSVDEFVLLLLD